MINTKMTMIRKRGESLRQVERFFLCVRAIMSIHIRFNRLLYHSLPTLYQHQCFIQDSQDAKSHGLSRSMTIKTLEDFVDYMRTYMVGRCFFFQKWFRSNQPTRVELEVLTTLVVAIGQFWNMGSIKQIQYIRDELTAQIFYSKLEQVCRI